MKKVINGKMYNTDTAKEIESYTNGLSWTDFNFICKTLYQKRTGEYFIFISGGARSIANYTCEDGSISGGYMFVICGFDEKHAKYVFENIEDLYYYGELKNYKKY